MGNIVIDTNKNQIIFTNVSGHIIVPFDKLTDSEKIKYLDFIALESKYNIIPGKQITLKKITLSGAIVSIIGSDDSNVIRSVYNLSPDQAKAVQDFQALITSQAPPGFILIEAIYNKATNEITINGGIPEKAYSLQAIALLDTIETFCVILLNTK